MQNAALRQVCHQLVTCRCVRMTLPRMTTLARMIAGNMVYVRNSTYLLKIYSNAAALIEAPGSSTFAPNCKPSLMDSMRPTAERLTI